MDVTIRDIALATGVSIRTVSRVLNKSPKVNENTRKKIEAMIAERGFRPSLQARGLATGRSFLIGMVHNDRNALVLDAVLRGIVAEACQRDYEVVVHPTPTGADGSVDNVLDFAQRSRVDGLVVLPPVSGVIGLADALRDAQIPAVALSAVPLEGFASVLISDERGGAACAAEYLMRMGHTSIAMISGPAGVHSASERRAGFVDMLTQAGLTLLAEICGDYGFESGFDGAVTLLRGAPRPTAIFAANDVMAAGVLKAATGMGIAVPAELSVIGFDDSILARMLTPALTTVRRPIGEMAELVTRRLLDFLDGSVHDGPGTVHLTLTEGGSSGPAPGRARPNNR